MSIRSALALFGLAALPACAAFAVLSLAASPAVPAAANGARGPAADISAQLAASSPSDPPGVLVSRQLLEESGLAVGEVVLFSADPRGARPAPFRIVGSYEPRPDPMRLGSKRLEARLHLPDLIALMSDPSDPLASESVASVNVALHDRKDAAKFSSDLISRMPGLVATPTASPPDEADPFVVLERFHLAIAIVTVIGSTAFLLALMAMRADERRETVGILRLIGFTRRGILLEVLVEGLFIAVAGAVFGVLFATATQGIVNQFFQWRYDTALVFVRVTAPIAARCIVFAVPLGVLAGLAASWTLLRRDIVALLRR